ncbi:RHS repeat-associated core domain-containing protein [Cellulomonas cellasea]|nr:RHS repeat-associated core domain-containing protein [Cellulomonas cellasea]
MVRISFQHVVVVITVVACSVVSVGPWPAALASAVEAPTVVASVKPVDPGSLSLTVQEGDATTLVATGAGDDLSQPVVIQADDGAILATCIVGDDCAVEVSTDETGSYIARAGDTFSEPVVLAWPETPEAMEAISEASRLTLPLPKSGEETTGTDNGWGLTIGTRPVYQHEPWDTDGAWGHISTWPTSASSAWYEFYANATPPAGVDLSDEYEVLIRDKDIDNTLACGGVVPGDLSVACSYYHEYQGPDQHEVAVEVRRHGEVIASLPYDGWYDRYLHLEFWPQNGGVFLAGEPITLRAASGGDNFPWDVYSLYLQETTSGEILASCDSSPCIADASPGYYTGIRAYRAFAADPDDPTLHVAASTSYYTVSRDSWYASIWQYGPVQGGRVPVIVTTGGQDVGKTGGHYRTYIVDLTAGTVVKTCTTGTQCVTTVDATKGHTYAGAVASSQGPDIDVQAVSWSPITFTSDGGTIRNGARWETSGGYNPSIPSCQTCAGDPVNTYTGEFWDTITDLSFGDLKVTRNYGSTVASIDQGFGHGWSGNLRMRLEKAHSTIGADLSESQQLVVIQENGSFVPFARTDDGFATAARVQATLVAREDGTYAFERKDGQTYVFAANGELTTITDRNGNTRTLTYTDGDLTRIADDRGRSIDLSWTDGHVTAVTDSTGRTVGYTYDAADDLVEVTDVTGGVTTYEYDSAHQITAFTDPNGARVENVYDRGRVVQQTDALDRVMTFVYDIDSSGDGSTLVTAPDGSKTRSTYVDGAVVAQTVAEGTSVEATTTYAYVDGLRVATTDPAGETTTVTYDSRGNQTSATDPLGRTATSTYDEFNNPLVVTNPAGEATTFAYDERGNLLSSTGPDGAQTTYTVNPDGTVASVTDALERATAMTYDMHGFLVSMTAPDGAVATTAFDSLGRQISATSPLGNLAGSDPGHFTSTYTYDAAGRQLSGTDPLGAVVASAYDTGGRPTTVTDATGATTTTEYDLAGRVIAVVDAAGSRTVFSYDDAGRVTEVTDATGASTSTSYDALGRPTAVTDALGRVSRTEYDAGNRVIATVTPSGARTTYTYDAADQLLTVTDPLGKVTTTTYDQAGRPVTVTDADGRKVTTSYDATGRPVKVLRADGSALKWEYDATGHVTATVDASGARTTYTYDAAGRRASATDTAGRTTTFGYDAAGLLTTLTQADGSVTTYGYDAAGRRLSTDYSDDTPDVATVYDLAGRPTTVTDGTGTTAYAYDVLGRVLEVANGDTSVGYAWDKLGRLTDLTYPTGEKAHRVYDAAGQLTKVTDWADRDYTYTYDADGRTEQVVYPNDAVTSYDRDDAGQPLGITVSGNGIDLLELAYGYTDAGLLADQATTRSTQSRAPPATAASSSDFAWDGLGRIEQITGDNAGAFAFDAAGSVTTLADGRTLAYDSARQLTTLATPATDTAPAKTTAYGYDARGNRATATTDTGPSAGTVGHTYNQANQLTSVTGLDGTTTSYTYAATGLRATATTGTAVEQYTWDTLAGIPLLLTDATHAYVYGNGSTPLAQVDLADGSVDYLHTDALGSVRSTTDHIGAVTSDADYDAYGIPQAVTDVLCAVITRFGYAGEYTDATGYLYLRARYYDPTSAQFLTRDPLEATTGNPYGYTDGNPLQFTDPLGLFSGDWGTLAAGVVNLTWGTVKVAQGGAIVFLGATATVTLVGAIPGVVGAGVGVYHIGSGIAKAGKGARQIEMALQGDAGSATCTPADWKGDVSRFLWGTIPLGSFLDERTDWLDKWGSLP